MPWAALIPVAMAVAGAGMAAAGSKKAKPATSESGFQALPPEVQRVLLESYLPGVQKQFNKPYTAPPMKRVGKPKDIFDSQGLADLQQYSDSMGGMFTPINQKPGMRADARMNPMKDVSPASATDKEVMAKYGMTLSDYITNQRPDFLKLLQGDGSNPKFTQQYGTGGANSEAAINWWKDWGSRGY